MLIDNVKIGNKVEIYLHREQLEGKPHISRVEDIISESEFLLDVPISFGQLVKLRVKTVYYLIFFTDKGMIKFKAEILRYLNDNPLNFIHVKLLSEGEKIQRRAFFRFACLLPLRFKPISDYDDEESREGDDSPYFDGIIKDIGGGGIRFISNEDVDESRYIMCVIMLDDELLMLKGKVLNKQNFPESNFQYQYRIEFCETSQNDQDVIIKYIFSEERKVMKKLRP